jgi:hypothetical protein
MRHRLLAPIMTHRGVAAAPAGAIRSDRPHRRPAADALLTEVALRRSTVGFRLDRSRRWLCWRFR